MILKQKQGYQRREFELVNDILKVKYSASGEIKEWTVNLESIGENIVYNTATRRRAYIFSAIIATFLIFVTIALFMSDDVKGNLPVVLVSYLIFGGLIPLILLIPLKKEMHLVGGSVNLTFYQDSPTKEEANRFVNELIAKSKKLLVEKYGKVDPDLPEETMMNQFIWLKNRNLISEETYLQLKQDYKTQRLYNHL